MIAVGETGTADPARLSGVQAVDRALAILGSFDAEHPHQTLAQLARRTGFYKSTILRLARSLERAGYLHRTADGAFRIGAEPLRLAAMVRRSSRIEDHIRPILRQILDKTGESTSFFRREGAYRLCLCREDSRRAIRDHVVEGDLLPLAVGAAGHVLTRCSQPGARDDPKLRRAIISFGERDAETAAIAVPVFSQDGLAGALTISGPRSRLLPERMAEFEPVLVAYAQALTIVLSGFTAF